MSDRNVHSNSAYIAGNNKNNLPFFPPPELLLPLLLPVIALAHLPRQFPLLLPFFPPPELLLPLLLPRFAKLS